MSNESLLASVRDAARPGYADLNLADLRANRPDLVTAIEAAHDISALLASASAAALATGRTEGAAAERQRVLGIQAAAFAGQEALAQELIADGKTSPAEAALRFNQAEKAKGGRQLQALADADKSLAAQPALAPAPTPAGGDAAPKAKATTPEGWKAEYAASADLQAEFRSEGAYVAFKQGSASGRVRILNTSRDAA